MEPSVVNPYRFAKRHADIHGELPIAKLLRLKEQLAAGQSHCEVELAFAYDEVGRCLLVGRLTGTLFLQCQRCLGGVPFSLDIAVRWLVSESEKALDRLPAKFELILTENDRLDLHEALEAEIILNLPTFPHHLKEDCTKK